MLRSIFLCFFLMVNVFADDELRYVREYQASLCNFQNPDSETILTYPGTNKIEELIQDKMIAECKKQNNDQDFIPFEVEIKRLSVTKNQDGPIKCKEGSYRVSFSCKLNEEK